MKIRLTPKQLDKLFELGVPKKAATRITSHINSYEEYSYYYFTVTDLLDILPKKLDQAGYDIFINIYFLHGMWVSGYEYLDLEEDKTVEIHFESNHELIDSLYQLVLWCIENKCLEL